MNQYKQPTRCNLVIEFIIPKFIEGSTCFKRHTFHHQGFQTVFAAHVVTGRCPGWVGILLQGCILLGVSTDP